MCFGHLDPTTLYPPPPPHPRPALPAPCPALPGPQPPSPSPTSASLRQVVLCTLPRPYSVSNMATKSVIEIGQTWRINRAKYSTCCLFRNDFFACSCWPIHCSGIRLALGCGAWVALGRYFCLQCLGCFIFVRNVTYFGRMPRKADVSIRALSSSCILLPPAPHHPGHPPSLSRVLCGLRACFVHVLCRFVSYIQCRY